MIIFRLPSSWLSTLPLHPSLLYSSSCKRREGLLGRTARGRLKRPNIFFIYCLIYLNPHPIHRHHYPAENHCLSQHNLVKRLASPAMLGSSYHLQASRPRQPPAPLNFDDSSFQPSSILSTHQDAQTLLYDLPSAVSMSPPTSPKLNNRIISPTSPSFPGRSRATRNGRPTPPPSGRHRSSTPLGVAPSELEKFAEHCRAW